jgi:hypothetical protein
MDPKEFDQKLVEKIKEANISPKPRWYFLLKNYVVWGAGLLSLLVGALAVSVLIYLLRYNGWETRVETHKNLIEFLLLTMPYFWLIFLGIFIFILYYNLKHTNKGYRYPVYLIILSGIIASIVLGGGFYLLGIGQKIDNVLGQRAPFYETVINRQIDFWFNPAEGRLVGIIVSDVVDNNFNIIDPTGNAWQIINRRDSGDLRHLDFLVAGQPVNMTGQIVGQNQFRAEVVRPLVPGREFFSRPRMRDSRERCLRGDCLPPPPLLR